MDKTGLIEKKVTENAEAVPFFPDEIITNILIRLSVKDAMRCRLVCRKWRELTLNRDFVDLHFRNSLPTMLFVDRKSYCRLLINKFDKWWEPATTENVIPFTFVYCGEKLYKSRVLFSHAGIIVLQEKKDSLEKNIVILNPARSNIESVSVTFTEELDGSEIYGVYYHPSLEVYCSLWEIRPSSPDFLHHHPNEFQYKILNLGSNPSLKTISNPFSNRVKMADAIPLLINNYLYWKLESEQGDEYDGHNDIMKFDVLREEFTVIHCPVPLDTECESLETHLLDSDGVLSFLLILPNKITIWRLEDHVEQVWTTSGYTFNTEICDSDDVVDVIAVVDGKLALQVYRTLHVCNLVEGTVVNYCPDARIPAKISYYSHQMSLASLCNGKTRIFIDQGNYCLVTLQCIE